MSIIATTPTDAERLSIIQDFAEVLGLTKYLFTVVQLVASFVCADMYNFIMDVYEDSTPVHQKRIKDAVEQLPKPSEKTGLLIAASDLFLNESDSQQNSQEMLQATFRRSSEPASNLQNHHAPQHPLFFPPFSSILCSRSREDSLPSVCVKS